MDTSNFAEKGYDSVAAGNLDKLAELRAQIHHKARELAGGGGDDPEEFMNNFHRLELRGTELNKFRVELINYCTEKLDVAQTVYEAFSGYLTELVGPDIVVQKNTNLVIQQPGDPDQVPTHRDAPLNSPFEVVVWIPLVSVYGTKSMYVLDREKTDISLQMLKNPESGYEDQSRFAMGEGDILTMPFGHALFFWPGLVHAVGVNVEQETRWALNIRYKNLFAPSGAKGQAEFFQVLRLSPLARLALEYEKGAYG